MNHSLSKTITRLPPSALSKHSRSLPRIAALSLWVWGIKYQMWSREESIVTCPAVPGPNSDCPALGSDISKPQLVLSKWSLLMWTVGSNLVGIKYRTKWWWPVGTTVSSLSCFVILIAFDCYFNVNVLLQAERSDKESTVQKENL